MTIILGAGISGLSLAWQLAKQGEQDLLLLEAAPRVGGWMRSVLHDGFLFELGPRGFRPKGRGTATLQLVDELGLTGELAAADASAAIRYLWQDGALQALPHGIKAALKFTPAILKDLVTRRAQREESIDSFFRRRFGSRVAEGLADPMVAGIFAGKADELSMEACFPQLHRWEQERGSVVMGMLRGPKADALELPAHLTSLSKIPLLSFKKGMEVLPATLGERLDAHILSECEVQALHKEADGVRVETNQGVFRSERVISTLPAHTLFPLLDRDLKPPVSASLAVICCGFQAEVLPQRGFGYLVASSQNERILGMVWDSCVFPQQNQRAEETRVTLMIGGARQPELLDLDDDGLLEIALDALRRHAGINATPDTILLQRVHQAIPQFTLGHRQAMQRVRESYPWLHLAGTAFEGVAVNDCVWHASQAARAQGGARQRPALLQSR